MKFALSMFVILASIPMSAWAAGVRPSCAKTVSDEAIRVTKMTREFVESGLAIKLVSVSPTADPRIIAAKVYLASQQEDDPANYERYKFLVGASLGAVGMQGDQGCTLTTAAQKTLR